MSLWADYVNERLNWSVIEDDNSFIAYSFSPPFIRIEDIYIRPSFRRTRLAWNLVDRIVEEGKKQEGIKAVWTQVWAGEVDDRALKAVLHYGFRVIGADGGRIILTKDIGGNNG